MFKFVSSFVHNVFKSTSYLIGVAERHCRESLGLSFVSFEHFLPLSFIRFMQERPPPPGGGLFYCPAVPGANAF